MPEVIGIDDARYAFDLVSRICAEVGPGLPGSAQERQRADIFAKELESHLGAENVSTEEFTLAPGAFLGVFPLSATCILIAAVLNLAVGHLPGVPPWLTASAALALSLLAPLSYVFEYMLCFEFIDWLFPKRRSVNVIGTLRQPGTQSAKRLLMLSGHHDSALENTWIRFLGYGMYITLPTGIIAYVVMLVLNMIQLAGVLASNPSMVRAGTLTWVLLAYPVVPTIVFQMFFNMGRRGGGTVPGAADNLSASALAVAMCRFLVQNPSVIPDGTEIRFISFGGEEAGCRGSRRYVERHLGELKRLDARLLNYETVAHPEIVILTADLRGVKHSPEMLQGVVAAAERAGVPYKVSSAPSTGGGGTDSGWFSKNGLKATTLLPFKVPQQVVAFYHQKWDTPDVLTIEPLLNVLKLTLEWIRNGGE